MNNKLFNNLFVFLICVSIGSFLGYIGLSSIQYQEQNARSLTIDRRAACGQICLRIAANLYGIPCNEHSVLSVCPPDKDGTRLNNLKKAATKLGMTAKIAAQSWKELVQTQNIVILHVNDNH